MKLSVAILFCLVTSISRAQPQIIENIPLLTVTGEAVVKAVPDQAIISVRVDRKIDIANISAVSDAFLFSQENTAIKFVGDDNKEIFSTVVELHVEDKTAIFIKEFIVTVYNLADLPKVIMELFRHGFKDIYSISYRLSNLQELRNNARSLAIQNARAAAQSYASALGQGIGKAHLVKEEDVWINNWYVEKYKPDIHELINTNYHFNPGYITIPCRVIVSYNLL